MDKELTGHPTTVKKAKDVHVEHQVNFTQLCHFLADLKENKSLSPEDQNRALVFEEGLLAIHAAMFEGHS
jgi:hypothetical protein